VSLWTSSQTGHASPNTAWHRVSLRVQIHVDVVCSHTELGVVEVKHLGKRRTLVARYDRYSLGEAVNGRLATTVAARATTTRAAIICVVQIARSSQQISHESSHVICLNLPKLANLPLSSLSEALISGWLGAWGAAPRSPKGIIVQGG
jgi:hypothetical protein